MCAIASECVYSCGCVYVSVSMHVSVCVCERVYVCECVCVYDLLEPGRARRGGHTWSGSQNIFQSGFYPII